MSEFLLARYAEDEVEAGDPDWCDCAVEGLPLQHGIRCPVYLLADLKAKRELVTDLARMQDEEMGWDGIEETVMSFLVQPYADHPDHQDEWDWV